MERFYYWNAMKDGDLLSGMYTTSSSAATSELARQLAKPHTNESDGYALIEATGRGVELGVRTIIEIVSRVDSERPTYTLCGITADVKMWELVGMTPWTSDTPFSDRQSRQYAPWPTEGQLIAARLESGSCGDAALVLLNRQRLAAQAIANADRIAAKLADAEIHAARINRQAAEIAANQIAANH